MANKSIGANSLNVISAKEILEMIKNRKPVVHNDILIVGDIDLRDLNLPSLESEQSSFNIDGVFFDESVRIVTSKIQITNSEITGKVIMNNIIFEKSVGFFGTNFCDATNFDGANFLREANFEHTNFWSASSFSSAKFFGKSIFSTTTFFKDAAFDESLFIGVSNFSLVQFREKASFLNSKFKESACFDHANFKNFADFGNVHFAGFADFDSSTFGSPYYEKSYLIEKVSFRVARFDRIANFGNVRFYGVANFVGSEFKDLAMFMGDWFFWGEAIFEEAIFRGYVNFSRCYFNKGLNLRNSEINNIVFLDSSFRDGAFVTLSNLKFSNMDFIWESLKKHLNCDETYNPDYLALINNLKKLGQNDGADDCYYQYRERNRKTKKWGWSRLFDEVAHFSCGYGVRPGFVLASIIFSIFVFAFLIRLLDQSQSIFDCFYLSGMTFTTSIPGNLSSLYNMKYALVAERVIGTLLLSLFVVVLTKKLMR